MLLPAVLGLACALWAADPFIGTWKLNVAKSKYNPGPAPRSATLKIEGQDNGYRMVLDGVGAKGETMHFETAFKFDGRDYRVKMSGAPSGITVVAKRINAYTFETTGKQGGNVTGTSRNVVSGEGNMQTLTSKEKTAKGLDANTIVYDRQ